jgi:hypothetical protein
VSADLRLDLTIRTYKDGDKWTWTLWKGSRIVATSGSQLFSRRIDATRGAEVGTGVSGVYDALQGVKTERGADAPRLAFRRMDGVAVRVVDARRRS